MKKSLLTILTMGFGLCAMFRPEQAEALFASIKATGMGQVGAAYAQDTECVAFNPAGLVDVGNRIDLGVAALCLDQEFELVGNLAARGALNGKRNAATGPWVVNPHSGISYCLCDGLVVGLTTYNNAYAHTCYNDALPLLGSSPVKLQYIQETIAPTIAYRINDIHSVGLTINVGVQRFRVQGLENFNNAISSVSPGNVTNRGCDYAAGVGATIGWLGRFCDWLSVGISYQTQIQMSRFHKYKGFVADHGRLDVPASIVGGITISPMPCWDFCFDVRHTFFSNVRALHNKLHLSTGPADPDKAGSKGGVGFGWRDQTYFRFGTAYQLLDYLTVRCGYRYATPLIPRSQTATNLLTCETIQNVFSLGASYQYGCDTEFSFYYSYGFNNKIKGKNSVPVALGSGNVNISQSANLFGFEIGQNF